jgi:hypothetical protein
LLLFSGLSAMTGDYSKSAQIYEFAQEFATKSDLLCEFTKPFLGELNDLIALARFCENQADKRRKLQEDLLYLMKTADPGGTMLRQGPELALGRLHPEFAHRLAGAIREARRVGLPHAGVFSAYRPPAFGVGGFSDKFNSLHTYGLAADLSGIGQPGSPEAFLWRDIASRHGISCPYGPLNRKEWNHCQPTNVKAIRRENPLRATVTADGPIRLGAMFTAGNALIDGLSDTQDAAHGDATIDPTAKSPDSQHGSVPSSTKVVGVPSWCRHTHHPRRDLCGTINASRTDDRKRRSIARVGR